DPHAVADEIEFERRIAAEVYSGIHATQRGRHYRAALALMRERGDKPVELAAILVKIGHAEGWWLPLSKPIVADRALACFAEAETLCREAGDTAGYVEALYGRAMTLRKAKRHDKALPAAKRLLEEAQRHRAHLFEARAHRELARLAKDGQPDEALAAYTRCVEIFGELKMLEKVAAVCKEMGKLEEKRLRFDAAAPHFERSIAIQRELGDDHAIYYALRDIGGLHLHRGDFEGAVQAFQEAAATQRAAGRAITESEALLKLGRLRLWQREFQSAFHCFDRVVTLVQHGNMYAWHIEALHHRAEAHLRLGRRKEAFADLILALERARAKAKYQESVSLVALGKYYRASGEYATARRFLEKALPKFDADSAKRAECARLLGRTLAAEFRFDDSIPHFRTAMEIYRTKSTSEAARTLILLGDASYMRGDYEGALAYHRKALDAAERFKARPIAVEAIGGIGRALRVLGKLEDALAAHQRALTLLEQVDNAWLAAWTYQDMAILYGDLGENEKALACQDKAIALYRRVDNKRGVATIRANRSNNLAAQGDEEAALKERRALLPLAVELEDKRLMAQLSSGIARSLDALGRLDEALPDLERAIALAREMNHTRFLVNDLSFLGGSHRARGEYEKARPVLNEALELTRAMKAPLREAEVLRQLAWVEHGLKGTDKAQQLLESALALVADTGARHTLWELRYDLSRILEERGDLNAAARERRTAIAVLEEIRGALGGGEKAQESFLRSKLGVYESMVELLGTLIEAENDPKRKQELVADALGLVARARFEILSDAGGGVAGSPKLRALLDRIRQTQRDLARLEKERQEAIKDGNTEKARRLTTILATTTQELAALHVDLKAQNRDLAERLTFDPRRIGRSMRNAPENARLVVYFPGEKHLHVWVFHKRGILEWNRRAIGREQLYGLVGKARDLIEEVMQRVG
ncbi:MAG: tetratricopeptide repeat protein, partial [Planctomycetota bacterium]|nr:tetratricopeptide repeat protein [Planctomycetota bacterium]